METKQGFNNMGNLSSGPRFHSGNRKMQMSFFLLYSMPYSPSSTHTAARIKMFQLGVRHNKECTV